MIILLFLAGWIHGVEVLAGSQLRLTLAETMARARTGSLEAAVALDELRTAYWGYRSYRAELLPELVFTGTVPAYHKQYSPYMDAEGQYSFVANNYLQLNGQLSVTQNIWLTGGQVSVSSSLDYLRQLSGDVYNRYMSVPVALTLSQPLFAANTVKWDRRIEPVRWAEALATFMTATQDVAVTAIGHYFSLLMAGENLAIARQNLENAERLYAVAVEKREMGQISRNDLLQMELNVIDARSAVTDCESAERSAMFTLRTFLDIDDENVELVPVIPEEAPKVDIPFEEAYAKAMEHNAFAHNQERQRLEADYAVAKARGDMRSVNVYAQIGYTGTDRDAAGAYRGLRDNQVVEVGLEIPLVDWGKRRGRVKVAESNRRVTESRLRQEARTFRQDLFLLVERYGNQRDQLDLASRADSIAAARYETNVETYMVGRLSTLDLNDSRVTKDEARRAYVNELYLYWLYYYQLRGVTLWDFVSDSEIIEDVSEFL